MTKNNLFEETFNIKKIGSGHHFKEGGSQSGDLRRMGMASAFRGAKWSGSSRTGATKNLSSNDIDFIDNLVGGELKKISSYSKGLNLSARKKLKLTGYNAYKSGKISYDDYTDLKNIIDALGPHE